MLTPQLRTQLQPVLDRLIPRDDFPAASEAGVLDYLARHWQGDLASVTALITAGLTALEGEAAARYGLPFGALGHKQQDTLLRALESNAVATHWPVDPPQWLETLTNLTAEGYYSDPRNGGNRDGVAWQMVGYKENNYELGITNDEAAATISVTSLAALENDGEYDAIVIGTGAAGGLLVRVSQDLHCSECETCDSDDLSWSEGPA